MKFATIDDTPIVNEFPDVFPEELLGMPPKHDVEFIIELLPTMHRYQRDLVEWAKRVRRT